MLTQEDIKRVIKYDKNTGDVLRNCFVRGKGDVGDQMNIPYNKYGTPYISIGKNKYTLSKILVLYIEGFMPYRCRFIDGTVNNFKYNNILYDPIDRIPTQDYVRKSFNYNPTTGLLKRAIASNGYLAGEEAGKSEKLGYRRVKILGKDIGVHRIIWLYMEGYFPENEIDHINREPSDNRWCNLREVSAQCNIRNQKVNSANTSGVKGVCPYKDSGKWFAYIYINSHNYYLGQFSDFAEAVCHRLAAEQCLDWDGCSIDSSALIYIQKNINKFAK